MSLITTDLTTAKYDLAQFELTSRESFSQTQDGRIYSVEKGTRYWTANFKTVSYNINDSFKIIAALDSLKGNHAAFFDPSNTGLRSGDDFADNLFRITAISSDRSFFSGDGIPNGITFTAGDYLSVIASTKRILVRVAQDVKKTGTTVNIKVIPSLRNSVGSNQFISCRKPSAYFQLLPGSIKRSIDSYTKQVVVSFDLIEFLA